MRSLPLLALFAILAASHASAADCGKASGNLLSRINCGFDQDAKGWTASPQATVTQKPADRGVLHAIADPQGSLTITGPCVAAQPDATYEISAQLRTAGGTPYFCSVNLYQYSDKVCGEGAEPLGSAPGPPAAAWSAVEGAATAAATSKSMQLHLACSGEPSFAVQFDDFVIRKK